MNTKIFEAPNNKPEFSRYWSLYIEDVTKRDNFKMGHLEYLRILCQLLTEFDKLTALIEEQGFTYETDPTGKSRYGNQIKVNANCTLRDKTLSEIRQYTKLLSINLEKDKEMNEEGEKDEWE